MRILALLLALLATCAPFAMAADLTTYIVKVNATGATGSAAGSATSVMLSGYLEDVYLDYDGAATSSTDVTIAYASRGGNILVATNRITDGLLAPRLRPVDNDSTQITDGHDRFPIWDKVTVTVAQGTAATPTVTVYLRVIK